MKKTILAFGSIFLFIGIALIPGAQSDNICSYIGWIERDIREEKTLEDTYTVVKARWLLIILDMSSIYIVKNGEEVGIDCTMDNLLKYHSRPAFKEGYFIRLTK